MGTLIPYMNSRSAANALKKELESEGWDVSTLQWNWRKPTETLWWIIPFSKPERPAFKYGKLFFSPERAERGHLLGGLHMCEKVISKWYANLDPRQRDPHRCDNEEAIHFLTRLADQAVSFSTKVIKLLPNDYGFGALSEWTSLHTKDYAAKLKQAKGEIDKAKPDVQKPDINEGVHEVRETQEMYVEIPKGATRLVYTLDGTDPRQSESAQKINEKLDLVSLLKGRPSVKVKMRAIDQEGNFSEPISIELVSKERKYEIQVEKDIFGEKEAIFKWPSDAEGLVAVLKSIIAYGVKKSLLSAEKAEKIEVLLRELAKKK